MKNDNKEKLLLSLSMIIFGTIGLFRRYIDLPSGVIAMARGLLGMLSLLVFMKLTKKQIAWKEIKANLVRLLLTGTILGFNWILLFESYRYTTVATATLCYYIAPVIAILVSPFLLKEKLTVKKLCCVAVALIGMILVSGVLQTGISNVVELRGVFLGLAAAVLYAAVIVNNKKLTNVPAYDRTFVQLGTAGFVLIPYNLLTANGDAVTMNLTAIIMLLVVGVLHTGVTYALYFGSMKTLKTQTVALYSYIDPIVAILCSALLLHEHMEISGWIGACLVLGATIASEISENHTS